ncbi:hypothetical protein FA15DRAFT_695131 [Coprinopsis marcescibilis]|uniref:C2H2-type domain-containing protein n=1 Tax=Coprinopsis marcescibilis TaxID=230819 RepID=A0A5C3KS66_COPMA|nr:hypothetical protein FA15DRAFT_695131 [Coprinopsis marcescibilis]
MLTQSDAIASLLSLAIEGGGPALSTSPGSAPVKVESSLSTSLSNGGKHHRRLSSTGKTRRRLSDAREAANRPSPALLQSNPAALSLASLTLSSSPPISTSRTLAPAPPKGSNIPVTLSQQGSITVHVSSDQDDHTAPISIPSNARSGKKRGMDHKCESCSKIYRHPSCLIKHRWEHTPHWREASKFVLSKHQQVQLLEAAAILSHMSPAASGGRSLPEDRSLWPSFLSGGSLPPPEPPIPTSRMSATATESSSHSQSNTSYPSHPASSSVPARALSSGPRLHDYGVGPGVVTQVRPGLIGVTNSNGGVAIIPDRAASTGPSEPRTVRGTTPSQPVPVPGGRNPPHGDTYSGGGRAYRQRVPHEDFESSWGGSFGYGSSLRSGGGLSLPNSSIRSSGSSPDESLSRSRSGSIEGATGRRKESSDSPPSEDGIELDLDGISMDEDRDDSAIRIIGGENGYSARKDPSKYGLGIKGRYSTRSSDHHTPIGYSPGYGRGHSGRHMSRKDDDDLDPEFSVREEDEDMDDMDVVGRLRRPVPITKREEEWDGMDMEMDMD